MPVWPERSDLLLGRASALSAPNGPAEDRFSLLVGLIPVACSQSVQAPLARNKPLTREQLGRSRRNAESHSWAAPIGCDKHNPRLL